MPKISVIIPSYYNGENIPVTAPRLIENEKLFPPDVEFEYVMVDDGSKDKTFEELKKFQANYPHKVKVIKLARNFGANNASFTGINYASGDCMVVLAADLQDPPELIEKMYTHWKNGYKLVLAQKADREDSLLTKIFSNSYHFLIRKIALKNAPKGGFDLWLFDKQVAQEVIKMNEKNFYLPYLFIWLGYEYVSIPYTRRKREIGKSGWTLSKKIKSFIDSFVSFSFFPLRLISILGLILGIIAFGYGSMILYGKFIGNIPVEGWTSIMLTQLFIGSFIMISIGIIGEYLWRTLDAARNRPNFVVDQFLDTRKKESNE